MKVPGSLPRSRFLDVTQRSFGGALRDIQKTAAREIRSQEEHDPLSFHKLCADMQVNKTKFERNNSLECYYRTCIGKTKHTS